MLIIADIGSNWKTYGDCVASIYEAKQAGADVVKFQCYDHKSMYGLKGEMGYELPIDWIGKLKLVANNYKIELACTAFCPKDLKRIDQFVDRHKIASSDMCYPQLLDAAMETNKPLIISTGGKTEKQILQVMEYVEDHDDTTFLYCSSSYPCRDHDLRKIDRLRALSSGRFKVGYSDHTLDVYYAPYMAIHHHMGVVLEKHLTCIDAKTPDSGHSLNSDQFDNMTRYLRDKDDPICNFSTSETPMVLLHNRRLVATKRIIKGDVLRYGLNYGAFRIKKDSHCNYGYVNPMDWKEVEGTKAEYDIKAGYAL